uniref:Ig-like domain-containing protein n=1 Tax=Lates calcarifer TaxID=8187 RepID=A0A4W6F9K7_LATCA
RLKIPSLNFVLCSRPEQVKVTSGSNAVLRCQSPRGADIKTIEWTRPDLEVDGYIFFYENNRRQDKYQHPSFHGRVELENESAIKDGDVSVSLKNVTEQDAGTYVCLVSLKKTRRSRRDIPEQLSTITLTVQEPGEFVESRCGFCSGLQSSPSSVNTVYRARARYVIPCPEPRKEVVFSTVHVY